MKNMTLKEIAVACGGIYYGDDESYYKEVSSVVIDSRKVEKDCLFIAIRGAANTKRKEINPSSFFMCL